MVGEKGYPLGQLLLADYDWSLNYDGIDGERLARRLEQLAQIGLTNDKGSNRPGFSFAERQAKQLVVSWMIEAGLVVTIDGAGNVFGRLQGTNETKKTILSGSQVDSVPNGDHFDGPLGVLRALEVVEEWKETNYDPERSYEVVIFSDEEGARFNSGLLGSKAAIGALDETALLKLVDYEGVPFVDVLEEVCLTKDRFF